jgi:hypothetical protein
VFSLRSTGSFTGTEAWLRKSTNLNIRPILDTYGKAGVDALESATPVDTRLAANSWFYRVEQTSSGWSVTWHNSDVEEGFPVALRLQIGYATGTGGYVQGRDYINPQMRPIFDKIAEQIWKAVKAA